MFWVYLMWLVILFGLQVSATLQKLRGRSLDEIDPPQKWTIVVDATSVLTVMEIIAEQFVAGHPVTSRKVAELSALPEPSVMRIVERLVVLVVGLSLVFPQLVNILGVILIANHKDQKECDGVSKIRSRSRPVCLVRCVGSPLGSRTLVVVDGSPSADCASLIVLVEINGDQ